MVMTIMVIIIPPTTAPLAAGVSPRSTRCSRGDHAGDGHHRGVGAWERLERRADYSVFYGQ
jgi:hypothetical protein